MKYLLLFFPLLLNAATADFNTLMGKNSEHWEHIQTPEDQILLTRFKTLYEKNIPHLAAPNTTEKIPRLVHFIWIGPKPFPPQSVENVRSWIAHHPDWKVIFWTDRDRPAPCNGMEMRQVEDFQFTSLKTFYDASDNYGEKSDLLRYEILHQIGGVYADHDANCLQPFTPLHSAYDFYCCFETPHPQFAGRNLTCGIGLLGSRPNHPAISSIISWITTNWDTLEQQYKGQDPHMRKERVLNRTYIALTHAIQTSLDQPNNTDIVLPAAYFFAKQGIPSLYSKHFYNTTWADDKIKATAFEKNSEKLLSKTHKRLIRSTIITLILLSFGIIALFKRKSA